MAPPSASDPTSPMKISAGCALYQRKPRLAPVIEPQKMVSSEVRGLRASCRYSASCGVAAGVGQHRQRARGDHHQADGQAVQAVGQVDGVRRDHHHQRHEQEERRERPAR